MRGAVVVLNALAGSGVEETIWADCMHIARTWVRTLLNSEEESNEA